MPRSHHGLRSQESAFAGLLDGLRALAAGTRAPVVVLAEVLGDRLMPTLTQGLAERAEERGIRLGWAELGMVEGRRRVWLESATDAARRELDLAASPTREQVREWLTAAGVGHDLLLVVAPPLDRSLDGALLACEGDGLVLAAENGGLSGEQLKSAVERAKATGCLLLGLVMLGHREWLPGWLGKLLSRYPRSLATARLGKPKPAR